MEAPLVKADPVLQKFAAAHRLKLSKNYHNEPERSLTWDTGIRRLIQLYLQDPKTLTLNLWLCASQDLGGSRFWRREFLVKDQRLDDFFDQLPALLEEGYARVNSWTGDTLEFGTKLRM